MVLSSLSIFFYYDYSRFWWFMAICRNLISASSKDTFQYGINLSIYTKKNHHHYYYYYSTNARLKCILANVQNHTKIEEYFRNRDEISIEHQWLIFYALLISTVSVIEWEKEKVNQQSLMLIDWIFLRK